MRGRAAHPVLEDDDGHERDAAKLRVGRRAGPGRRLPRAFGGLERRAGHWHLTANDELFLAVGEAIRRGERPDYDNLASVTEETLQRRVAEAGGMTALVDRLEATSARLIEHAESLSQDEAAAEVRFHVFHDGHTLVDEVRCWGDIVAGQGNVHIPIHIRQLRALIASQ